LEALPRWSYKELPEIDRVRWRWFGILTRKRRQRDVADQLLVVKRQKTPSVEACQRSSDPGHAPGRERGRLPRRRCPGAISSKSLRQDLGHRRRIFGLSNTRHKCRFLHHEDRRTRLQNPTEINDEPLR
jgi:hypothetical protein